ncbi:lactonase family protein [Pseudomonas massiliensis]|uniref:lactonase family protein n=1 Tax=Pseudomonas massiliensis TaxID=522492 RepID=UPI00058D67E5|nr:lactonase family protein [Pseudomonas massiliensis]
MYAYVGSRTTRERNARGDGITVFHVDQEQGTLDLIQLVDGLVNPSFLALNRAGTRLYTVHGDQSEVSAFTVAPGSGRLSLLNRQSCHGKNPVHLALDPSERYLLVSNHISGTLAVLALAEDGRLGELVQLVALEGPVGPHRVEQRFAKPHFNPFDPSGRFVLVPDKGLDRIFSFRFDGGRLSPAEVPFTLSREGAGPRHIAMHPEVGFAYAINELDSTLTAYRFDPRNGSLEPLQVLPSLPDTYTGNSRAAEVEVSPCGRFLYASNRGDDSLAVFAIAPASGRLSPCQFMSSGGRTPRFFTLTPNGRFLFALNEDSDTLVAFAVNPDTGALSATGFRQAVGSPVCMVFSR